MTRLTRAILAAIRRPPSAQRAALVGWRAVRDALHLGPNLVQVADDAVWQSWPSSSFVMDGCCVHDVPLREACMRCAGGGRD